LTNLGLGKQLDSLIEERQTEWSHWQNSPAALASSVPWHKTTGLIVSDGLDGLRDLIDRNYHRVCLSPVISPHGRKPANLLIFAKVFNRRSERYGVYNYDCLPIIGKEQREHLKLALERCRRAQLEATHWLYPAEFDGGEQWEKKPRYSVTKYDEEFGRLIHEPNGKGIDAILDCIEKGLSADTRLFVEHALSSGSIFVNRSLFDRGTVGKMATPSSESGKIVEEEYLRFAYLHYVLLLMAPAAEQQAPSLLMVPLRVAGAPWCTAVSVRNFSEAGASLDGDQLVDEAEFQRSYLFYHFLMRPFQRRLRRWSKEDYMHHVGLILAHHLRTFVTAAVQKKKPFRVESMVRRINEEVGEVCRIYPYERIRFYSKKELASLKLPTRKLHESHDIWFGLERNPWFISERNQDFLKLHRCRDELWAIVRGESGHALYEAVTKGQTEKRFTARA
jgi:hypothetical protein